MGRHLHVCLSHEYELKNDNVFLQKTRNAKQVKCYDPFLNYLFILQMFGNAK